MRDDERPTITLEFERADTNIALLHEQLKAVLGDNCTGVSTGNGRVRVHILPDTPPEVRDLAGPVVTAHDPAARTPAQQKETEREALLGALRKPWATWTPLEKDRFLCLLAERLGIGE